MTNTIAIQVYLFFIFFFSGIAIGIFFDFFRIIRKSFKTSDILTYIEDIVFWIFAGYFFLFVLFKFNNGQIRSYVLIGTLLGILLYTLVISKIFINIGLKVMLLIKKLVSYPIRLTKKILLHVIKPISIIVINLSYILKYFVKKNKYKKKNKKINT